jgi:hypothetical protein
MRTIITPFIVYGLPRSKTYWCSHFLSYGNYKCYHEQSANCRSFDDIKTWFSQDEVGLADTAASAGWQLVEHLRPDIQQLVIRRDVNQCIKSVMALNKEISDLGHEYKEDLVIKKLTYLDRCLDKIEKHGKNVMSVKFEDLNKEDTAKMVFEHCLPYKFDKNWFDKFANLNLIINARAFFRYKMAYRHNYENVKKQAFRELLKLKRDGSL